MSFHVAVDIGASSGRVMLATLDNYKKLDLQEMHRFKNEIQFVNGHYRWDIDYLFEEILTGLSKIRAVGVKSCTLGIDTWAVDYCLLDKSGHLLDQPIAYRDERTDGAMEEFFEKIPAETIYAKTGIQFLKFNTLYQLFREDKALLEKTDQILMVPDYLAYRLTGINTLEVTNASTTQFMDVNSEDLDADLLAAIGVPREKFPPVIQSGQVIGSLLEELKTSYDLPACQVIAVATHDTASAVVGVPSTADQPAYISSGTWSLIGVENRLPIATPNAFEQNYTNERGAYQTYRFLKNITGMWAVQEIARMLDYQYSYAEMAQAAYQVEPYLQYINLNDDRFTKPENMITEIQAACRETGQIVPESVGELTMCVYSNLALLYAHEWKVMQELTGETFEALHIVGGGSNVKLLNQLTADVIGKPVIAGPGEATAIGNLMVQLIAEGQFADLKEARSWLQEQFDYERYEPKDISARDHLLTFRQQTLS
ncbi:rhamnulokinase [Streptococcus moroccensis]|uniref:Rhamnulokinase n=1 Tax=Streptococcus moroccensis TaxID=1451356 RepID=A0ABT9YT71_9STRE|nr:rhamnulokinase [Streptococcus moroccensis]MDQ0223182.1 rhamnulokinase [Streptococcus moroccensis]